MVNILIDLSYINSENKARESLAIYAFRILDGISAKKHSNITLLVADEYKEYFKNKYPYYKLLIYPSISSSIVYRIPYVKGLFKLFKWKTFVNKLNYDVIYIPFAWSGNSLSTKAKKIITIHDLRPMREPIGAFTNSWWFKSFQLVRVLLYANRFFYSLHLKNASKIITISNYTKKDICNVWPNYSKKILAIYNGVLLSKTSYCPKLMNEHIPYILYVNSLSPYKNVKTLIQAFEKIKDQCHHKLVIVGKNTNYWMEIEKYIRDKHFSDRIIRIDYVTDAELRWLYEHSSLFVTTSTREGFGYTPIEAAICGCPVISTMAESLPEVTAGKTYYYDPPYAWDKLALLILNILKSPKDASKFNAIAKFFLEKYDNEKQANKIYNVINLSSDFF